jgi:soluble lytic murein transglycosylase
LFRSPIIAAIAICATTFVAGLPIHVLAANKKNTSVAAPKTIMAPEEAFRLARAAVAANDLPRLQSLSERASEHPLRTYVEYWDLRLRLARSGSANVDKTIEPDTGLDTQVKAYIDQNSKTVAADLLRRDWMLQLGKRGDWQRFESVYSAWALQDDKQAQCYAQLMRLQKPDNATAVAQARAMLAQTGNLGEGCNALAEGLVAAGKLSPTDLQSRILLAAEQGVLLSVRRLSAMHSGYVGATFETALTRPAQFLISQAAGSASKESPELLNLAWTRYAVTDPENAAILLSTDRFLSIADKAFVWTHIAAGGARKTKLESAQWSATAAASRNASKGGLFVSDETLGWAARAALRAKDFKSVAVFVDAMSPEGQQDPTWIYWRARAYAQDGKAESSALLLKSVAGQFNFYGQLASEELGVPQVMPSSPQPAAIADDTVNRVVAGAAVERAFQFYDLGMRFEGNREWNYAIRGLTDSQLLAVAAWAYKKGAFDRAVSTAERTTQVHDFSLRFITPFKEALVAAAQKESLDPAWVYGLIRQESRFIMDAKSSVGAAGLMQLMPGTARWVAQKLGVSKFQITDLKDIDTNLAFGNFYLRTVMDGLDGNAGLASAAYNAGPNRPRQWRSTLTATIEGAAFAETIPFSETRDYVKKVLSNAVYYSALLTGQGQSLKSRLGEISPKTAVAADTP